MTTPEHIQILPDLAAWFRNLNPAEAALLDRNLQRDGLLDTLKWAKIVLADSSEVETLIDGHQRWLACKRLGIPIPADKWELITKVRTVREAREWMYDFQAGRRNWSPNEVALMAAQEYEEDKLVSGVRTDLYGKKTDTAEVIGERFGKTGRWVRDAVQFAKALDELKATIGIDAQAELLQESPPINRDTVIALAQAPEEIQREAWELVMKRNTRGIPAILDRAKKQLEGTGAKKVPGAVATAASRYDLADLVHLIDSWSIEMVKAYNPVTDVRAASYITNHLGGAIEKLIILAEASGLAGEVLDAYVERQIRALKKLRPAAPAEATSGELDDAADHEPDAVPAAPRAAPGVDGDEELRQRLAGMLQRLKMSQDRFAKHADVSQPSVSKFLAGTSSLSKRSRANIEAALADLADFLLP